MPEIDEKNKNKVKKEGFFKIVLKSIKNFEKYEDFGLEGIGKTSSYLIKIVAIFTLIITAITMYKFSSSLNSALAYFDENVRTLTYESEILNVNDNEKLEISSQSNIAGKIIIDTSELNEEQINEYRENIKNEQNGIVLLRNKLIMKNEMLSSVSEISYKDFLRQYGINSMDKQEVLNYFQNNEVKIYSSMFATLYICMFAIYIASFLVDALVLGALGYITARIIGMKIRFSAAFSMGVHALTLPIILNMLYVILNGFTGYTIKYFQFMYTAISYIYVITAILIIKSDYIKRSKEVEKIKSVQEQVREEIQAKKQKEDEENEKEREELEKKKRKDKENKERNKRKQRNEDAPDIGDKPEGSNV